MDIFGKALIGFLNGKKDALITITRDDGWVDTHSPEIYFRDTPLPFEEPALKHVKGGILDVGCGAGRHLRWYAKTGFHAFGCDNSQGAIYACSAQGLENVALMDIMAEPHPVLPFPIETISLFGNNIGIGGDFDGAVRMLKRLRALVQEDVQLVLTGLNVRATQNERHIAYQENNIDQGRRRGELKLRLSYDGEDGPEFRWYHPEPQEIEELAILSGWKVQKLEILDGFFWSVLHNK